MSNSIKYNFPSMKNLVPFSLSPRTFCSTNLDFPITKFNVSEYNPSKHHLLTYSD